MKRILAIVAALGISLTAFADEGMWLLPLLQKMNGKALKEAGCRLTDLSGGALSWDGQTSILCASAGVAKEDYFPPAEP